MSKLVELYAREIQSGRMMIEEVPFRLRTNVQKAAEIIGG